MHKLAGGVQETEADEVFVAMVPDVLPNVYFNVCVKLELCRLMLIVRLVPIVPEADVETVDAGKESVIVHVLEPTFVLPLYVSHVIVHDPEAPET